MPGGGVFFSLGDPVARAVILPLAVSMVGAGAIRLALGEGRGSNLASLGLAFALLAAWGVLFGLPNWPAFGMAEKAIWLMALGLILGAAADRIPALGTVLLPLLAAWPVVLVLWLWATVLAGGLDERQLVGFGGLLAAATLLFGRLRDDQDAGQAAPLLLLWLGVALGLVAYITGLMRQAEAGAALSAAVAGYLLWNIPVTRYPFGLAALLAGGTAAVHLAASLFAQGVSTPLWPLLLLVFADEIGTRLLRQRRGAASVALGGLLPVAAAVALAYLSR